MILAATGHRPAKLGGYDVGTRLRCRQLALATLTRLQPDAVISGMAQGWDTAIAAAAITLEIPLIAAVPFEGQESVWPDGDQDLYRRLLAGAAVVEYICAPGYAVWKMQVRNQWMVDYSTHVAALWDGSSGGTANCLEYARSQGVPVLHLWQEWVARA